jgi:uncharacterized membrane protein
MEMDHGILNVPLAKRGDIDAQIDQYKADEARRARAAHKAAAELMKQHQAQAKAKVAALSEQRTTELMARFAMTRKQLTAKLNSIAHWTPEMILKTF